MKKRIACLLLTFVMVFSLIPTAVITASAAGLSVSEAGVRVIKDYVGFHKTAYEAGGAGVYKIGYGTPGVAGQTITEANADKLLRERLAALDGTVNAAASAAGVTLVQKRHDALVWYTYIFGDSWTADAGFMALLSNGTVGTKLADYICGSGRWAVDFPDDAAARADVYSRMPMVNLYQYGVYSATSYGPYALTVFDAGEGVFSGSRKKIPVVFDTNEITKITVADPTNGTQKFLGWYCDNALITGVSNATAGKTVAARWQEADEKVLAQYTLPAYVIYEAQGIPASQELVVYKDPTVHEKIDTVSRDAVIAVAAERIVGTTKWLELATGGWVELCTVGSTLPTVVPAVTVTITDDYVNIRKEPSVTAPKVGIAKRGETRTIVMTVSGDAWGYCSEGWIFLAYTTYNAPAGSTGTSTPVNGSGVPGVVAGADRVNVRTAAGVGNPLATTVARGTAVTVYEQTDVGVAKWGRIDQGWISMEYVQLKQTAQTGSTAPTGSTVVVNTTASLNIRSGPGTEYSKIGILAPGTSVVVLQKQTVNGVSWARIEQGWINMNYVSTNAAGSGSASAGVGGTVVNCTNGVNIRSAAGTTNALVGVAALGSRVTVTERVEVNGHYWGNIGRGWVCMDYIQLDREFVDPVPEAPETGSLVTSFVGYPAVTKVMAPVYASASSDAKILMTLNAATDISVTDRTKVGTNLFGKVTVGNITGWVNLKDVQLQPVNAMVTAARADAYERPSTRSVFYASLVQGTYVTVGMTDGSGWELSDGALWGQVQIGAHSAWIKLSDVTMFKENTLPTGITSTSGVGYLTGSINADAVIYQDSNGNVTSIATQYTLVAGHRVNVLARNFIPGTGETYGKVTVGSVTGWIDMANVTLDVVEQKATEELIALDAMNNPVSIPAGSKITILTRELRPDTNEINHGVSDWGHVYVDDDADTLYWLILDAGRLTNVTTAPVVDNSTPAVLSGVVVTGRAPSGLSIYEEAVTGSAELLKLNAASYVTILNWKNVDGKTWGKVQVGKIVGWVDISLIDFSGLKGTVRVADLSVYAHPDKNASVQVLRLNNRTLDIDPNLVFDGSILWGKIAVSGKEGYIDLADVLLNTPGMTYSPELVMANGRINSVSAVAFLADSPASATFAEVVSLPKDTTVNLLSYELHAGVAWWLVDLAEKDGWTNMEFINMGSVVACVTEPSISIFGDLVTADTPAADILYTLYRDETVTVNAMRVFAGRLYGEVTYGTTTGWIQICDEFNNRKVSLTPGSTGTVLGAPAPTTPTAPAAPVVTGSPAYISGASVVNVRTEPNPLSDLVTTLAINTPITVYEQTTYIGKRWARIDQGWVCMDYVTMGAPAASAPAGGTTSGGSVSIMTTVPAGAIAVGFANEDVRIRTGAGLGYPEAGTVKKGNSVVIYEKLLEGGMIWGRTDQGYVCISYFTLTGIGASGSGSTCGTIGRCAYTANIRSSASTAGALMGKVMVDSRVVVRETAVGGGGETWARTDMGWINMQYVVLDAEAAPLPGAPEAPAEVVTEVG